MEVTILSQTTDQLMVEFKNVDVSVVNALRRTILTEIYSLVIRGFPHKENLIKIKKNTTKFNNEYIKHRLSCIPINLNERTKFKALTKQVYLSIHYKNYSENKYTLSTDDFKVIERRTDKIIKLPIFKTSIPICYIYPKVSSTDPPEEFEATIDLSRGTAKDDSCWNMVSKCTYYNVEDEEAVKAKLEEVPEEDKRDFELLNAQRYYIKNRFNFIVETIHVYTNENIMIYACEYILEQLKTLTKDTQELHIPLKTYKDVIIEMHGYINITKNVIGNDTMYILRLAKDDYTIGKLIEKYVYFKYKTTFKYISFKKEHPHDLHSIIQLVFYDYTTESDQVLIEILNESYKRIKDDFNKIKESFSKTA